MANVQPTLPAAILVPAAPTKRTRGENLLSTFGQFRAELDAHQERRERIVKLSRDITALSKKLIFALHRITSRERKLVMQEADAKLKELRGLFERLQGEVEGENFWRYEKSVSPGIQEFLEGLTFYHYLLHRVIPTLAEVVESHLTPLPAPIVEGEEAGEAKERMPYVLVTSEDYLGGIADLTGELMRLAINSVGASLGAVEGQEGEEGLASIGSIANLVREIKGEMDPLAPYARWLGKKLTVLDQSLSKIESASYALRIRGAEYADSPAMMKQFAQSLAAGGATGGD